MLPAARPSRIGLRVCLCCHCCAIRTLSSGAMLFKTITSFTVAHSITLAIATLGYASAPAAPLNAAIAFSISFVREVMAY